MPATSPGLVIARSGRGRSVSSASIAVVVAAAAGRAARAARAAAAAAVVARRVGRRCRNTRGVAGDVLQQAHHLGLSGHDGAHLLPQRHAESFCALLEPALLLQLLSEAVEAAGETMQPGTEVQHLGQAGGLAGGLGAAAPPPPLRVCCVPSRCVTTVCAGICAESGAAPLQGLLRCCGAARGLRYLAGYLRR